MKVIVFGATGKTGIEICKELERQSIPFTSFVRTGSEKKLPNKETSFINGDVMNPTEVKKAIFSDLFTDVIVALGSKDLKGSGIRTIGTQNIIDSIHEKGKYSKLHVISALGVRESWKQLKWHMKLLAKLFIGSTMKDHHTQETAVVQSGLDYHILRPVELKDGDAQGNVHVQNEGFLPSSVIQRADVAQYLVNSMIEGKQGVSGICNN